MSEENLIYTIAGENYILVEVPFIGGDEGSEIIVRKYGLIYQGVKEIIKGTFFVPGIVVKKFFLPEKMFKEWAKESAF